MTAWKRGRNYSAWVRLRDGSRIRRSLETSDRATAREIERMLDLLIARRDWELVEAGVFGPCSIGQLFDAWRSGDEGLSALRAALHDVDLAAHVDGWERWALRSASKRTVADYRQQLKALVPDGKRFPRSTFTRRLVSDALTGLKCSGSTARRYLAAWSSFGSYLVECELLDVNPIRSVKAPRNNPPREMWLPLADVVRLVDAQPEPFRALAALREGAGVEISAGLQVRRRDVDLKRSVVHVRGTKNRWRNRPVLVEQWASERIGAFLALRTMTADALLFDGVTRRRAWDIQQSALKALSLPADYRLHDARHSYAVRQMQSGADPQIIANNLGHKDTTMLWKIYGKYRPTVHDLERERMRAVK